MIGETKTLAKKPGRRSRVTARIPKALFVVCSTPGNPHADSPIEVFTSRQKAERAFKWGDQRLVVFVPQVAPVHQTRGESRCEHGTVGCRSIGDKHACE